MRFPRSVPLLPSHLSLFCIFRSFFLARLSETLRADVRQMWSLSASPSIFIASFHLRVPFSEVLYTPSPSEAIKWAWVQYLAAFWLLWFFLTFVREFVFAQGIVETKRVKDGTPK